MNLTDSLQNVLSGAGTLNRYRLDIPSCPSPLDVEDFSGIEGLSRIYRYDIIFTSTDKHLDAAWFLCKPATLTMGGGLLESPTEQKKVHGVITHFRRISGSADQTQYLITLKPFLFLLDKQHRSHRFFVNKSVPEVVEQVLQEHNLHGWEYEFNLKQSYPKREQINQYQESDLAFIQRLLAEVGIFYWFTLQEDAQTEVVHFTDAQRALVFGKTLPVNSPSGMSDSGADSVWGLNITHNVVEASVTTKDYNHRDAQSILQSAPADMTRGDGEGVTYGDVYHYRLRHLARGDKIDPTAETANFYARLDHERFLANQTQITGYSTAAWLAPAQVLNITDGLPPTLPAVLQEPVLVISTHFTASRKSALLVDILGVPYSETVCWRPAPLPRPKVTGTMTARITSAKANDIYAWQDASGLYRVKFDADRDEKGQGQESMPVRLAKPYGGDVYGFHFPLIQGTEVAIAFHEGDPDRPYIAHALHDSRHVDHVTEKNSTRNVIRTPTNNKLRMEDKRGEEHIKLSTEYGGKTQLNLGHNVDASRELRGEGFELRTDKWGAIRGGKGIFISGDVQPSAQGKTLDMNAAIAQLQSALELVTALAQSVAVSGALDADRSSQQKLSLALNQLKEAGILASAPAGIALTTPRNIQLSSGHTLTATAGENIDMSIFKRLTVAAGEAISLFAQKMGIKIFAARGIVDIQAQTDAMRLQSDKTMTLNSVNSEIILNAAQGITLTSTGGAYIKIKNGSVEIGAPGKIDLKSANILWGGVSSLEKALQPMMVEDPQFKYPMNERFQVLDKNTDQPKALIPYRIETADGVTLRGMTDENGYTQCHYGVDPKSIKLFFE
ncbi:type VI secretion system tip protein VgrG [Enterobacter hormaechei]|uniref:type VI secretion system Vgr family protein n=1 Tax=Enterobacter hormaechei TaxID=158836 RepID=UPI0012B85701|nr:type VI secretion system Vgr family protein [Enterobacter hormaechei]MBT2052690.1 type VI secretion system tip protein VgrG [Enterobacter hormaechei subsp. hoffmannii]MCH9327446.1 type VI secretion system tip protein VgrG [Enterobacter hormaechei]MCH9423855.1 type VI secretion system tip protein VgrG [Enterobacter hormaechei]MCU2456713.1 type VI secretion system tip protein VgrG [Enterobacter hormaechei subsp. hoffmannii]MCW4747121.1 type VI secretion system tip protein VgrG [Enterobacter h